MPKPERKIRNKALRCEYVAEAASKAFDSFLESLKADSQTDDCQSEISGER